MDSKLQNSSTESLVALSSVEGGQPWRSKDIMRSTLTSKKGEVWKKTDSSREKSRPWNWLMRKMRNTATVGPAQATQSSILRFDFRSPKIIKTYLASWVGHRAETYKLSTLEAKVGSLWVRGQLGLQSKALCQNRRLLSKQGAIPNQCVYVCNSSHLDAKNCGEQWGARSHFGHSSYQRLSVTGSNRSEPTQKIFPVNSLSGWQYQGFPANQTSYVQLLTK